jgi:hypothetical protein
MLMTDMYKVLFNKIICFQHNPFCAPPPETSRKYWYRCKALQKPKSLVLGISPALSMMPMTDMYKVLFNKVICFQHNPFCALPPETSRKDWYRCKALQKPKVLFWVFHPAFSTMPMTDIYKVLFNKVICLQSVLRTTTRNKQERLVSLQEASETQESCSGYFTRLFR